MALVLDLKDPLFLVQELIWFMIRIKTLLLSPNSAYNIPSWTNYLPGAHVPCHSSGWTQVLTHQVSCVFVNLNPYKGGKKILFWTQGVLQPLSEFDGNGTAEKKADHGAA